MTRCEFLRVSWDNRYDRQVRRGAETRTRRMEDLRFEIWWMWGVKVQKDFGLGEYEMQMGRAGTVD